MKKAILVLFVSVVSLNSCKKQYTCHCDTVTGGDQHEHIDATSKKKAEKACEDVASSKGYVKCDLG